MLFPQFLQNWAATATKELEALLGCFKSCITSSAKQNVKCVTFVCFPLELLLKFLIFFDICKNDGLKLWQHIPPYISPPL